MNPHYTYLMVDMGCLAAPLLLSFYPGFAFYKQWKYFLLPCLVSAFIFLLWDAIYTHIGVWHFNDAYVVGVYMLGMPVEEYLFFLCIPFACVFTYHVFNILFSFQKTKGVVLWLYKIMAIVLLLIAIIHIGLLYTSVTFLFSSLFIFYLLINKADFLPTFFFCFLFVLVPFLISNGILTGSFLGRIVVQYNDNENLGLRLLTIPIEDVFYAQLLLMMNVYGYDIIKKRYGNPN